MNANAPTDVTLSDASNSKTLDDYVEIEELIAPDDAPSESNRFGDGRIVIEDFGKWDWSLTVKDDGVVRASKAIPYDGAIAYSTRDRHSSHRRKSRYRLSVEKVIELYIHTSDTDLSAQELRVRVRVAEARAEVKDLVTDGGATTSNTTDQSTPTTTSPQDDTGTEKRINRALTECLHAEKGQYGEETYRVHSSSGETYAVDLNDPNGERFCSCPDETQYCKHVLHVLVCEVPETLIACDHGREWCPGPDSDKPCCFGCFGGGEQ